MRSQVSIAYPPDTDTPGFESENKTKPAETLRCAPAAAAAAATAATATFPPPPSGLAAPSHCTGVDTRPGKTVLLRFIRITPPEVYPAAAVAQSILAGVADGRYHLGSPDIVQVTSPYCPSLSPTARPVCFAVGCSA